MSSFNIVECPDRTMTYFEAGGARVDVTPDWPVYMSGYGGRNEPSSGVHDPLYATSLVIRDGASRVAIVSVDLLNVSMEFGAAVRRAVATGVAGVDEVVLSATHTHGGPHIPARALDMDPALAIDEDVTDVVEHVRSGIVESVRQASERAEPATVRLGRARNDAVPNNRRAAGGVGGNVRLPIGGIDLELVALDVETESGDRTIVYNFACHPTCTSGAETLLTADWPGYTRERVESEHDARVLFLNGASADINPRPTDAPRSGDPVYEYMETIGTAVGETVLEAVADAAANPVLVDPPVRAERVDLALPIKSLPSRDVLERRRDELTDELDRLREAGDDAGAAAVRWDHRYVQTMLMLAGFGARRLPTTMSYVELGDVGLLGMPGEVFVEHGLDFKAAASAETLLPMGNADDYVGYLPTLKEFANGGYEVLTAKVAPEAIGQFRETAFDLIA